MRPGSCTKPLSILMLVIFSVTVVFAPAVHASMLPTGTVLENDADEIRSRIHDMLDAEEVQSALEKRGISESEARARVDAMTESQLRALSGHMDAQPSGEGLGTVVGAIVFVFIVLLITDIVGLTNVFPFVVGQR